MSLSSIQPYWSTFAAQVDKISASKAIVAFCAGRESCAAAGPGRLRVCPAGAQSLPAAWLSEPAPEAQPARPLGAACGESAVAPDYPPVLREDRGNPPLDRTSRASRQPQTLRSLGQLQPRGPGRERGRPRVPAWPRLPPPRGELVGAGRRRGRHPQRHPQRHRELRRPRLRRRGAVVARGRPGVGAAPRGEPVIPRPRREERGWRGGEEEAATPADGRTDGHPRPAPAGGRTEGRREAGTRGAAVQGSVPPPTGGVERARPEPRGLGAPPGTRDSGTFRFPFVAARKRLRAVPAFPRSVFGAALARLLRSGRGLNVPQGSAAPRGRAAPAPGLRLRTGGKVLAGE